ncbi:hypothetical protein [Leifsonia poae]|uniref:hypothetical protein n=1 Tax=Leifsonia poae TaxID=110933 RepID=UPI001CC09D8E|nr:hypothetical protein [Leifsonia poae]
MPVPTRHSYCSYFDSGYLSRGLALIDSLRRHGDDADVWVLCLDDAAKAYLDELGDPTIHTVTAADLEAVNPGLAEVKPDRSRMEYYFTCTPLLMRYVMDAQNTPGSVTVYLDSDLFFFDDPALVLDALGEGSVGIIEHRYPKRLASRLSKYGRYNVGWVGFRDDANGRACLDWWADSCLDWCYDTPVDGKYADQGYLDSFEKLFGGVVSLQGGGLNLAPWNTGRHDLSVQSVAGARPRVIVDGRDPLVFFHFHGIRRFGHWFVTSQLVYGSRLGRILREAVYVPYLAKLSTFDTIVAGSGHAPKPAVSARGNGLRGTVFRLQRAAVDRVSVATRNAVSESELEHSGR